MLQKTGPMLQTIGGRIEAELEAHILSGEWPPGHRVPPEHALMTQYACSRMTVSKVLGAMAARGLVVRRKRAGTFVAKPPAERSVLEIEDFAEQAHRTGQSYRHVIGSSQVRPATRAEARELELPAGSVLRALTCLHELGGQPIAWERRLILLDVVPDAEMQDFAVIPPGTWLLRHIPWSEAEHVISAVTADIPLASRLAITPGDACLTLHRRTWLQGALVTDVELTYPATRYRFSGRFSPGTR